MGRLETIDKLRELETEHRIMVLANRYLKARQPERLVELGIAPAELRRVKQSGGYSSADLVRMRDTIRYYRTKSRRKLWLPDTRTR